MCCFNLLQVNTSCLQAMSGKAATATLSVMLPDRGWVHVRSHQRIPIPG